MKRGTLWLLALGLVLLSASGCARYHQGGHPVGGDRGAAVDRGLQEMKDLVNKTVKDPGKAEEVKGILEQIVQEVRVSYQHSRESHRQLYELNSNYQATPEEFTKILDDLNNHRMRTAATILGLRFKMKGLVTPEEWKELTGAMDRYRSRYRGEGEGHSERRGGGY